MCATLDIRSKNLPSVRSNYDKKKENPVNLLKTKIESEFLVVQKDISIHKQTDSELEEDIDLFKEDFASEETEQVKDQLELEIENFLNEKTDLKCNLTWWKKNCLRFPHVAQLAKKYLPIVYISQCKEYYNVNFIETALKAEALVDEFKSDIIFAHFNK